MTRFLISFSLLAFGSWGLLSGLILPNYLIEIFWGMFGPWLVGLITIITVVRVYQNDPARLTSIMSKSFFLKLLFYGIYISLLIIFCTFKTTAFIISFTGYFVAFHLIEALYFQRTFNTNQE